VSYDRLASELVPGDADPNGTNADAAETLQIDILPRLKTQVFSLLLWKKWSHELTRFNRER